MFGSVLEIGRSYGALEVYMVPFFHVLLLGGGSRALWDAWRAKTFQIEVDMFIWCHMG